MSTLREEVPVEPLREVFARSSTSLSAIARHVGVTQSCVARVLTTKPQYIYRRRADGTKRRYVHVRKSVNYDLAVRLVEAMGLDPVDLDL